MVSTMIWVGLINPPFEVPLGQKGVPLSVSLDHRFTSLGAATAFILWKKGEKAKVERPSSAQRLLCRTEDVAIEGWGWWPLEMCRCHVALQERGEQGCVAPCLSFGMSDRGHSWHHLAFWAFSAAQVLSVLLPHLEKKLCLLGQPLIAKWQLCSYILVHKERTKWHLTSVYSLPFPNMVFEKCFGYF